VDRKIKAMTEIKVTGCHDCPFAECDYDGGLLYWCEHFGNGHVFDVDAFVVAKSIHPSCPLKQQSITVKLDQEYQKQKQ
jgi:hypothetical protein